VTLGLPTAADSEQSASSFVRRRLQAVHDALGVEAAPEDEGDVGALLQAVVKHVAGMGSSETWLLLVALAGRFPERPHVLAARRQLELLPSDDALRWLLQSTQGMAREAGSMYADAEIVTDRTLVDVNVTARWPHVTGVQRVVRETARLWQRDFDVELVVWNDIGGAYRRLSDAEQSRFNEPSPAPMPDKPTRADHQQATNGPLLVPWGAPLICLEVPYGRHSGMLATLAEFSPSTVRMVGYDCIPAASADLVPDAEPEKFARYVEVVKSADRVAAISHSAAREFEGLALALSAQGIAAPSLSACCLPTETELGIGSTDEVAQPGVPVILSVGSLGPRKNQLTVILAAEMLWREGLEFEVRVLGHGAGTGPVLDELLNRLKGAGRRLVTEKRADDKRVAETLAVAKCVIFPSLHEGFGLPVVEALSVGVPVVTSNHGSLQEIADGGGVVTVDAEDPTAVAAAMRRLLVDDVFHAKLVAEATSRPPRTWSDYANELWAVLGS